MELSRWKLRVSGRAGVAKACRLKQVQGVKQAEARRHLSKRQQLAYELSEVATVDSFRCDLISLGDEGVEQGLALGSHFGSQRSYTTKTYMARWNLGNRLIFSPMVSTSHASDVILFERNFDFGKRISNFGDATKK